ncbi:MAG: YjbQ family protein [Chloroflexi bacterium]|nr:YjbQ family protein [Chloroflexota bacterium]
MTVQTDVLQFPTKGHGDILDITNEVVMSVQQTKLRQGVVTIFSPSATSSVTTIEYEPGCLLDLRRLFDEIVDPEREYAHNARWGDGNGHSHVRAALLGPSLSVPFVDGRLTLGTWQQIIFIDFDNRPRRRELVLQVMGE